MFFEWLYLILLVTAIMTNALLMMISWYRRQFPSAVLFAITQLLMMISAICYLMVSITADAELAFVWVQLRFIPLSLGPVTLLLFVFSFTNRNQLLHPTIVIMLSIIPIITMGVVWLAPDFFWESWELVPSSLINTESTQYTGWFFVHEVSGYLFVIISYVLIVQYAVTQTQISRNQLTSVLIGLFVALVTTLLPSPTGLTGGMLNPVPIGFAILSFSLFWALVKQGLFYLSPLAYHSIIEQMQDVVFVLNAKNHVVLINQSALAFLHPQTSEEIIGKSAQDIFYNNEQTVDQYKDQWHAHFEIKGVQSQRNYDVRLSTISDEHGNPNYKLLILREITQQKRAEEILLEREKRLRVIAEVTSDGVYDWDVQTNEIWGNEQYLQRITIPPADERIYEQWYDRIHPDDRENIISKWKKTLHSDAETWKVEHRYLDVDGNYIWLVDHARIIRDEQGQATNVIGAIVDITTTKQLEEERFRAAAERERVKVLTTFIEKSSHEFRTPLSIIKMNNYLMTRNMDHDRRNQKVEQSDEQIARLTKLIDTLQLIIQIEGQIGLEDIIDLGQLIQSICDDLRQTYGDQPRLAYAPSTSTLQIKGNYQYLEIAFRQLLDNAYRFTPPEGTISVKLARSESNFWVEVKDTGTGISEDQLPHIFETFWRQDSAHSTPGLGLGLPILKRVIEHHAGEITVSSKLGKGTTFHIKLAQQQDVGQIESDAV